MSKFTFIIIALLFWFNSCADSPREYSPYTIYSSNKRYFAQIDFKSSIEDSYKEVWDRNWQVSVFTSDSNLFWRKNYSPKGYQEESLSDDGKQLVYIEAYYTKEFPLVYVSSKDHPDFMLKESDLLFTNLFHKRTSSHELWHSASIFNNDVLTIETNEGIIWSVNLANHTVSISGLSNWLVIVLLISISLIVLFCIRKRIAKIVFRLH
jgi:hypothetical protein